ncbi:MAG: sulfur carrier protein ThiS [Spirochaetales bacterium]|nr:sulfur carrier protein ThiS [Spirochaetales bacterium]
MVKINGEEKNIAGMTVAEYLSSSNYNLARIVTEINGTIVPKSQYADKTFADGDTVEIVSFVGGG